MQNNKSKTKFVSKAVLRIFDVILIIEAILLAFVFLMAFFFIKESGDINYSYSSMNYRLKDGDYGRLIQSAYENQAHEYEIDDPEFQEMYAVAEYAEARMMANAYKNCGDAARAAKWEARAAQKAPLMGLFKPEQEKIDKRFQIVPGTDETAAE